MLVASCGRSHHADAVIDGEEPPPMGDQSVFNAFDVAVEVLDYDDENDDPPIRTHVTSRISINGTTSAGRVPGLRIFGDGLELDEVGSAGDPPKFSFTHAPSSDAPGARMVLEFRYEDASFALGVEPLAVEITSPAAGETVTVDDTLVVQWSGIEAPPSGIFGISGGSCSTPFTMLDLDESAATFTRSAPAEGEPSCELEITGTWASEAERVPSTPFRSFTLARGSRRIHRFRIAPP
jgi:hypothetical protein